MNLTPRERAMEIAQRHGYSSWPHGRMPNEYKLGELQHLAKAWQAGYKQAQQDNNMDWI